MRAKKGKDAVLPRSPSFTFGSKHCGQNSGEPISHVRDGAGGGGLETSPTHPTPTKTCADSGSPGPGMYSTTHINPGSNSKFSRSPAAGFGLRPEAPPATHANPGPGAYTLPARPASPAYSMSGGTTSRRAAEAPGPGQYSPDQADCVTRPSSRAAALHIPLPPAFLPRIEVSPSPSSYSPKLPSSPLAPGYTFKGSVGHQLGAPAGAVHSPAPTAYSPRGDVGKLRSVSYTFGVRPAMKNPAALLPGPGAYDLE